MLRWSLAALLAASTAACLDAYQHGDPDDTPAKTCGFWSPTQCDADEYCDFPRNTCGETDEGGFCRPRPLVCLEPDGFVCGCDGRAYASVCHAAQAGFDEASVRGCVSDP